MTTSSRADLQSDVAAVETRLETLKSICGPQAKFSQQGESGAWWKQTVCNIAMSMMGSLNASTSSCVCQGRGEAYRSLQPIARRRQATSALLRSVRHHGRSASSRRSAFTTCVAAVEEEAPAASQEAATTSSPEEDDEFKFAFDFTNTDDLYKRFNELIERQAPELQMGDRVIGTVARCASFLF